MAEGSPRAAAAPRYRLSRRQQQQKAAQALQAHEEFLARARAKMERVTAWLDQCAAARHARHQHHQQPHHQQASEGDVGSTGRNSTSSVSTIELLLEECDGETEDLLLQVLIARPKYEGIPSVNEIRNFADQLRAYHARLWTLGMTRGFFRPAPADELLGWGHAAEYPDDIDSVESVSTQEENEDQNWMVHDKRVFVRKISPLEEELRDEMIQEYRNIRKNSVNESGVQKRFPASVSVRAIQLNEHNQEG